VTECAQKPTQHPASLGGVAPSTFFNILLIARASLVRLRRSLGTLRWRLTLTYVGLLALLLAALGTYQYVTLQRNLVAVRVDSLTGDYDEVRAEIARFLPRSARSSADVTRVLSALCTRLRGGIAPPGTVAAPERSFAVALATASGRTATAVVYNESLQAVAAVPDDIADAPRMSDSALHGVLDTRGRSGSEILDTQNGQQLAVAFPIGAARNGGSCGVAQLSTTTQPIDDVLSSERARLAIGGGAVLLIALIAGLLLTSRALKPLRRVSATAELLAGGDLGARSRVDAHDEVGTLGRSFDAMAERIQASFAAQAESEARMRRFLADASHELRTPVTALKGYIDVVRRGAARDPQALDAALEAMAHEADRMRLLVLDMLTLARLDAQRQLQPQPLDLGDAVGAVLDEGVPGMPPDVVRELNGTPVVVMADRNAVVTIARNLLTNAVKYAPGAAQRWEATTEDGNGVLKVHDDGPGIPAADLPHIFERFYRGEKTRAREEGGSGLGLSIVQGLAQAQGGSVSVESVEGKGTTFIVRLPLARDVAAQTQD
jgi:two-component system OmpR family sensor kinase